MNDYQFAHEEVLSDCGYPPDFKIKSIPEQTNSLRQFFPGIGYADEALANRPLPVGAEGYYAIPPWPKLASTYSEALNKVFSAIKSQRHGLFYDYHEDKTGPAYLLREHEQSVAMWKKMIDSQRGYDICIVPAQFGLRHRGCSVRRVRELINNTSEFGLGAYAVGMMLLTHPERLVKRNYYELGVDCAGDEFSIDTMGVFTRAPLFFSFGLAGAIEFSAFWCGRAWERSGSASGFLPHKL